MKPKRVLLFANGDCSDPAFYRGLVRENDYIICADGGARHALSIGLQPHLVIGDADSLDDAVRQEIECLPAEFILYPREKDKSDLELALKRAISLRPRQILLLCATGGDRLEHLLANVLLLEIPLAAGIEAAIIDETHEIRIMERELEVEGTVGDYLSLLPLTSKVGGVKTHGLKYPLHRESLFFSSTRGLSNEFTAPKASIKISTGRLLVIISRNKNKIK